MTLNFQTYGNWLSCECNRELKPGEQFHTHRESGEIRFTCPAHCPECASNARQLEMEAPRGV